MLVAFFGALAERPATAAAQSGSATAVAGTPGQLIEAKPIDPPAFASAAYRILYVSTGMGGAPIRVSGLAIVPEAAAPADGRTVVAWAHPTTGVVKRCAPSQARIGFQMISGLRTMLQHGYVVVATDYPGLGTDEPHPYLVGDSEARAVIDSVRAVRAVPGANISGRYFAWGHSQGGQAALFTGILSRTYAPELQLMGVAAAAPATDLSALLQADMGTIGGRNITAMTLWSWSRVYGVSDGSVIAPAAQPAVDRLMTECIESLYDIALRHRTAGPLAGAFLTDPDFFKHEPWASLLARNTPRTLPADIPVFLIQGSADQIVRPEITRAYARRLCAAGSSVQWMTLEGVGHGLVAAKASRPVAAWLGDRLEDIPAPNDCASI